MYEITSMFDEKLCPHIIGNDLAKRAVTLQLFSEPRLGEKIHILLIGEAASGKTDLAFEASRLAFRGTYNGLKITPVGMLEKLTEFDGSSCISQDELDKIDKTVRHMLLEAMELGQVTLSRQGVHQVLPARMNLLACANPRGDKLNNNISVLTQTNFSLPLLTRFNLVIPFESLSPDFYGDIARGINRKNSIDDLSVIKEHIIEQRAKLSTIKMPTEILDKIGREVRFLKENAVNRQIISPRTIHGYVNFVKACCRMTGVSTATNSEFEYIKQIFREVFNQSNTKF